VIAKYLYEAFNGRGLRGDAGSGEPVDALAATRGLSRAVIALQEEERWTKRSSTCRCGKFLKKLGVTAQREIELAVREQLEGGDLQGDETLDATATVTVAGLSRDVIVTGQISLA
jgi:hypothetical protein